MKLTIKEIADLKEGRKTMEEIRKTHDGTSMGKLRENLKNFISKYKQNDKRVEQIVSSDGKVISTKTSKDEKLLFKDGKDYTDVHLLCKSKMGYMRNEIDWNDESGISFFSENEMKNLLLQNDTGDYIFRSVTKVTNGSNESLTLIKSNNFDNEKYQELCDKLPNGIQSFQKEKFNYIVKEQEKWAMEQGSQHGTDAPRFPGYEEAFEKISKQCDEKYGFVSDFIDDNFNDLMEQSGVKLRFRKNDE